MAEPQQTGHLDSPDHIKALRVEQMAKSKYRQPGSSAEDEKDSLLHSEFDFQSDRKSNRIRIDPEVDDRRRVAQQIAGTVAALKTACFVVFLVLLSMKKIGFINVNKV